ncbi:tRNA 4-thiouridine(8) synthase ThiI [Candidatus Bathyarchaeota archaeon]|nr:tRNA 4-thiouridine(8) synthase ThiI [Candidatus Bathyarchaeota archaeon]
MKMGLSWNGILAAYGELALKSKTVRRRFVRKLISNIETGLSNIGVKARVAHRWSRILVETEDVEPALKVLKRVFGLVYVSPYCFVKLDRLEEFIAENSVRLVEGAESFAVRVRRTGRHSFTSIDLERRLGAIVKGKTGLRVSLDNPDRTVFVEVHDDECYVYNEKFEAPGGLPLGTAGKVVALVSTGIDSPVASWLMMRRGCSVTVLHAWISGMDTDPCARKFIDLVEVLKSWHVGVDMPVYVYRHGDALKVIREVASNYTCILCKRLMVRIAEKLAERIGAKAIVTGENLAQVASQTLENLYAIDAATEIPVLRPLIGFDKDETVELAKKLGTYEISVRIDPGCSARDVCWGKPPKPVTKAKLEKVLMLEETIRAERLVEKALDTLEELRG